MELITNAFFFAGVIAVWLCFKFKGRRAVWVTFASIAVLLFFAMFFVGCVPAPLLEMD